MSEIYALLYAQHAMFGRHILNRIHLLVAIWETCRRWSTQCSTVVVCALIYLYASRMLGNADDVWIPVTIRKVATPRSVQCGLCALARTAQTTNCTLTTAFRRRI